MTAFDDRLYRTLGTLAGDSGTVQIGVRQLAALLDVSDRTVRASRQRLEAGGQITVAPASQHFQPDILTLRNNTPALDLTEGLRCEREPSSGAPAGVKPPPYSPSATGPATTPKRQPDPGCAVCEGTGWMYLDDPVDTAEPCRCLTDEYRNWWRASRRRNLASWPKSQTTEPPAKSDYNALMLELNRRTLRGETDSQQHQPHGDAHA